MADKQSTNAVSFSERYSLSNYWPQSRKTKQLEEARQAEEEYSVWLQNNLKNTDIKIKLPNGDSIPLPVYLQSQKEPTLDSLRELVEPYTTYTLQMIDAAQRAKSGLREKREKSTRKTLSTNFMEFSKMFLDLADHYAGLVDVMKSADPQFGGPVYGTLIFFFSMAAKKKEVEDTIVQTFDDLRRSLHDMGIYRDVYPNTEIGAMIATIFKDTNRFFRTATEYYSTRSRSRFYRVLKPDTLVPELEGIKDQLANVQTRCQVLLAQQCRDIRDHCENLQEHCKSIQEKLNESNENGRAVKQDLKEARAEINRLQQNDEALKLQNDELEKLVEKLRRELKAGHDQRDEREGHSQLEKLLQHHGIPHFDAEMHHMSIQLCQKKLGQYHDKIYLSRMDLSTLQELPEYQQWNESETSSILLLSARTVPAFLEMSYGYCWLSGAALELISHHLSRGSFIVYQLCFVNTFRDPSCALTKRDVMVSLVSQLLAKCTHILHEPNAFNRLRDIHIHPSTKENENDISDLQDLMLALFSFLKHHEPIYIVLDRPDRCSNSFTAQRLVEALLQAVRHAGARIKVLVVVSGDYMDTEDCLRDLKDEKFAEGQLVFTQLQQRVLKQSEIPGDWR